MKAAEQERFPKNKTSIKSPQRLGLETSSEAYLVGYTKDGKIPEGVSLDLIAKVAGRITEMGEHLLPKRKRKGKESEGD